MNFSYYDLGNLKKGQVVEVQLTAAANVRLMDSSNYRNYKNGRKHKYYGGYVTSISIVVTVIGIVLSIPNIVKYLYKKYFLSMEVDEIK